MREKVFFEKVDGQGGTGCHNQGRERGHGGREYQNDRQCNENGGEIGEHGRDYRIISVRGNIDLIGKEPAEAAQEVTATGNDHGEQGGDDGSFLIEASLSMA